MSVQGEQWAAVFAWLTGRASTPFTETHARAHKITPETYKTKSCFILLLPRKEIHYTNELYMEEEKNKPHTLSVFR